MFPDTNTNTNKIFYWAGSHPGYLIFGYFLRSPHREKVTCRPQNLNYLKLENSNFAPMAGSRIFHEENEVQRAADCFHPEIRQRKA